MSSCDGILIRGVPDDVVAAMEANAGKAGLTKDEYLQRALRRELSDPTGAVTVELLLWFSGVFADLAEPDIMQSAWS